jgi:hypothetical protein
VLVNINKLKSYRFIKDRTLQPILVKPSDLVTDELVQTCIEPNSLPIKPEGFQHVEFELDSNYLTPDSIKVTNVHVHHYHNVPV